MSSPANEKLFHPDGRIQNFAAAEVERARTEGWSRTRPAIPVPEWSMIMPMTKMKHAGRESTMWASARQIPALEAAGWEQTAEVVDDDDTALAVVPAEGPPARRNWFSRLFRSGDA